VARLGPREHGDVETARRRFETDAVFRGGGDVDVGGREGVEEDAAGAGAFEASPQPDEEGNRDVERVGEAGFGVAVAQKQALAALVEPAGPLPEAEEAFAGLRRERAARAPVGRQGEVADLADEFAAPIEDAHGEGIGLDLDVHRPQRTVAVDAQPTAVARLWPHVRRAPRLASDGGPGIRRQGGADRGAQAHGSVLRDGDLGHRAVERQVRGTPLPDPPASQWQIGRVAICVHRIQSTIILHDRSSSGG
jgi:hypothetical protein